MTNQLERLADSLKGTQSHPDFLAAIDEAIALLRAASQETVGTEWEEFGGAFIFKGSPEEAGCFAGKSVVEFHRRDLHAARLAIAGLKEERDKAREDSARAVLSLQNAGWTLTEGASMWKPPIGKRPDFEKIDALEASLAETRDKLSETQGFCLDWQYKNAALQRAIDEALLARSESVEVSATATAMSNILRPHATKATEANSSATVTGSTQCDAASKLAAIESAIRFRSDATAKAVGDIIGNHSEPPKGSTPRQWTSTPPKDRSGKWWHKLRNRSGSYGLWLVPVDATWGESLREKGTDYDLWLPWQEGDTRDDLPPLPNQSTPASSVESGDIRYRVWECRVIVPADAPLPDGFDAPPRRAVIDAITSRGIDILQCASGWGHTPTDGELGVLDEEIHYPCQPATPVTTPNSVAHEFASVINRHSLEAGSNTPDWIVGEFLETCRSALDEAIRSRDGYYGVSRTPTTTPTAAAATPAADAIATRELVARLAEFTRKRLKSHICSPEWEIEIDAIIAAARRGGGA